MQCVHAEEERSRSLLFQWKVIAVLSKVLSKKMLFDFCSSLLFHNEPPFCGESCSNDAEHWCN